MDGFYRGADGAGHGCCGAVIILHGSPTKGNAAQRGYARGHKVHLKRKRAHFMPPTPIRGQIYHQGDPKRPQECARATPYARGSASCGLMEPSGPRLHASEVHAIQMHQH